MRKAKAVRPYFIFAAGLFALALAAALFAPASESVRAEVAGYGGSQLSRSETVLPADGSYFVNDDFKFTIARKYGVTLMRFAGDDEVFVLSVDRAPVGGRVLKYDTGDVALQVTGYGGVTIYTSTAPGGLPADRVGDGEAIVFPAPTVQTLRQQADFFAQKLEANGLALSFVIDFSHLDDGASRYLALDTMRIAARAIAGLCANRANQAQLVLKLHRVRIVRSERPGATMTAGVLTVAFAPVYGLRGRMSSLALARALRAQL